MKKGPERTDSQNSAHHCIRELESRIEALERDLQKNRGVKESLEERLRFEKLLSEISSEYTNLPAGEVDKTIENGLQRVGKFLNADRCNLAQFTDDKRSVRMLHSWGSNGIEPLPDIFVGTKSHFPWTMDRLNQGTIVQFSSPEELPDEAEMDRKSFRRLGTRSQVAVPISVGGSIVGALAIDTVGRTQTWPEELVRQLRRVGEIFANAVVRKEKEQEIQSAFSEIKRLKEQIEADCTYLREEIELACDFHNMIGKSEPLGRVIQKISQVAHTDVTVLVLGETGTGKELVARAIHAASNRRDRPMVKVNCASLPANLIESELFGHEKGAFTSAQARQIGRFELANGNTLFLDEIGELPLESQAKLLRVLQEGEFERLGSSRTIKVDVRIIAATNRDLEEEVRKGRFRKDLWYRLNVFPITVPPLRHRREDIPLLANWFVSRFSRKQGKSIDRIPANVMKTLLDYQWPGNIRELENVIERATINTRGSSLQLLDNLDTSPNADQDSATHSTLEEVERNHIIQILMETNWRIDGQRGAALILGLNPSTLRFRMRKLGIERSSSVV